MGLKKFYWFKQKHISTIFTQLSSGISAANVAGDSLLVWAKSMSVMGVNPETFFERLKLLGQNVGHHVRGNRMAHFRSLPRLYCTTF
jgi:hypothetical protein